MKKLSLAAIILTVSISLVGCTNSGVASDNNKNNTEEKFDIIIMPGIAFDSDGNRIGYGGGYYDKYISNLNYDVVKVALAYNFQMVNYIKAEEHDIKVNYIFTDKEMIYIENTI